MATEFKDNSISSVLTLRHVVFDQIIFRRTGFRRKSGETKLDIGRQVEKTGEGKYQVTLSMRAEREKEYEAEVSITGYCEIAEDTPNKDRILNENAIAILFPYVRAELTMLTAQPETEPLVIPAVNINALLKQQPEQSQDQSPAKA